MGEKGSPASLRGLECPSDYEDVIFPYRQTPHLPGLVVHYLALGKGAGFTPFFQSVVTNRRERGDDT